MLLCYAKLCPTSNTALYSTWKTMFNNNYLLAESNLYSIAPTNATKPV